MVSREKLLGQVLSATSDENIPFEALLALLKSLEFRERIKGSHHIFSKEGVAEILNLQPKGAKRRRIRSSKYEMFSFGINWLEAMEPEVKYEVIIYWSDEDQAFIAEVPELPGCSADGPTYEAALANVQTIITEWIETAQELGRSVPEPRGRLMFA